MKNYALNPVMNGSKSDVPNLTANRVGDRLRSELSALPHSEKDNTIRLNTPARVKTLSFLIDKCFVWSEHSIVEVAYNCFVNMQGAGKAFWSVVDYKIL